MTGEEGRPRVGALSTWTTRRWLRVGVALSLAILALLGATGAWVLSRTATISKDLVDVRSPALTTAIRLETAILNQETGIRGYGLTGTPDFISPYRRGLSEQKANEARLAELLKGDSEGRKDLSAVQEAVARWQESFARPVAAAPPGTPSPLAGERAREGKKAFDRVRNALNGQQERLRAERARARDDLMATTAMRNWVFASIGALIVLLTALIFEGLRRGINRPLEQLGTEARTIAGGEFDHDITPTGPADLRRLSGEIDFMRRRLVRELAFSEEARLRLDAQAAELQRSNAELEQFAYVASHDLQEPLRKVSSFTQLLQRRYAGQLDARADQYIDFAVDGANRMQVLINDLLDFSRVGRLHNAHKNVDLDTVLARTLSTLSVAIEEADATIALDPLPTLVADPTQMGMLWQNLLGNAVKFRRPGTPPEIRVTAEREGELWRFTITDNGIGIEPEYADKVFVIFQRLHTKDAYSGSGIGLAMCKKIVEFHGGTIGVDPEYREGARITFTLAPEPPEAIGPSTLPEATRSGAEHAP
ncbi:ATP-binding protein [Streptomyces sp. Je 1-369]|uniref:ATP-binding protein n=1 Tax=Streptomyces sp. Je 1-369 TaxID=2966192 RepID=UPI00228555B3|nr:ATP-binding protein [Streptomyces sp. Je 1-369]WAL99690.1 ATP-binding protein [Streptomyces sp. Je 1-369]